MKKLLTVLIIFIFIATPLFSQEGIFDLNQEHSSYLAVGSLALFIGVKNSFVLANTEEVETDRLLLTVFSYQAFVTIFAFVLKNGE